MKFSPEHKFQLNREPVDNFLFKVQLKRPCPVWNISKEEVQNIFIFKKSKLIGIFSNDLKGG
jgi:hypothetical protein